MSTAELPDVMLTEDLAAYLRVSLDRARRLCKAGLVPCTRFGKEYRIVKTVFLRWLEESSGDTLVARPLSPARRRVLRTGANA